MSDIPFTPFDSPLCDILRNKYIANVTDWLLGERDRNTILVQASNSYWEAASAIEFFSNIIDVLNPELRQVVLAKTAHAVPWLLDNSRQMPDGPFISWEGVTWDTSVIVRGLLSAVKILSLDHSQVERIEKAVVRSCVWLLWRFDHWKEEVKYPFGPADIAQILMTIVFIVQKYPSLYVQIAKAYNQQNPLSPLTLCKKIAEYLLHDCTTESLPTINEATGEHFKITHWLDGFNTAEVIEALGMYYGIAVEDDSPDATQPKDIQHKHIRELRDVLRSSYQWLETVQSTDGTWGSGIDTCRVFQAYVKLPALLFDKQRKNKLLEAVPYRVFKTLRWICDEKQVFSDGSFQHATFLTIFYAHAISVAYNFWDLGIKSVGEIYDDVVWGVPMVATPERSSALYLEVKNLNLTEDKEFLLAENDLFRKSENEASNRVFKMIAIAAFTLFVVSASLLFASELHYLTLDAKLSQTGNFYQLLVAALSIYGSGTGLIWRYFNPVRRPKIPVLRS